MPKSSNSRKGQLNGSHVVVVINCCNCQCSSSVEAHR